MELKLNEAEGFGPGEKDIGEGEGFAWSGFPIAYAVKVPGVIVVLLGGGDDEFATGPGGEEIADVVGLIAVGEAHSGGVILADKAGLIRDRSGAIGIKYQIYEAGSTRCFAPTSHINPGVIGLAGGQATQCPGLKRAGRILSVVVHIREEVDETARHVVIAVSGVVGKLAAGNRAHEIQGAISCVIICGKGYAVDQCPGSALSEIQCVGVGVIGADAESASLLIGV